MRIGAVVLLSCVLCAALAGSACAQAQINAETMDWSYKLDGVDLAQIHVVYPQISGLDEDVCRQINGAIKEFVVSQGGFDTACEYARDDYAESYQRFIETERYGLDALARVARNDRLLAVRYDFTLHTGGAHPWDTIAAQHYDLQTGALVPLSAMVDNWPAFQSRVVECIRRGKSAPRYEDFTDDYVDIAQWPERQGPLTADGLLVFYQEGDLGPVSAGAFELVIPYSMFEGMFLEGLGLP